MRELREWRDWRPMAFGRQAARTIRNPLLEPLWPGRRVLVYLAARRRDDIGTGRMARDADTDRDGPLRLELRDGDGVELAGHPELQAALAAAVLAESVVLDGYLGDLPAVDAEGAYGGGALQAPSLGSTTREMLLGRRAGRPGSDRRAAVGPAHGSPVQRDLAAGGMSAFVAVDLLALDGQPLLDVPLLERKRLLDAVLAVGELVRRTPHVSLPASSWYRQWRALGFRSMAVKDANSRYRPGEVSPDWSIAAIPER